MLGDKPLVGFVAIADADRARAFYTGALGLGIVHEDDFAIVFNAGGTMLRAQKVEAVTPQPFTVLGWRVEDVAATAQSLADAGVETLRYDFMEQDELGIWETPGGAKVCWFTDPDGNVLSVSEGPASQH